MGSPLTHGPLARIAHAKYSTLMSSSLYRLMSLQAQSGLILFSLLGLLGRRVREKFRSALRGRRTAGAGDSAW